jgi:hypothetical protein
MRFQIAVFVAALVWSAESPIPAASQAPMCSLDRRAFELLVSLRILGAPLRK